jgi:sterol desaturase/sphingolipid hydroxylase (fatty acid hydroxylase superfamily)
METLSQILTYLFFPIGYLMHPGTQYYWATYVGAAFTSILLYAVFKRQGVLSFNAAKNLVLPKRLFGHASTKLDFKLFFVGIYYLLLQVLLVGGTTYFSVHGTVLFFTNIFGEAPAPVGPSWIITGITMFLVFMAVEFGYWFAHLLMHKIPALWEFHKVHHSAEVLTPLTEWRQHPVELVLFSILLGGAACLIQGPMVYYFGASAQVVDPTTANYISMAFWYTILHLRHSELPFYATGTLGKIVQAPAHHQVHHSTNPDHFDKNLGYCLSVWDWAFGTLYIPKKGEKFNFGLGHQDDALETVVGTLLAPITRAGALIFKGLGRISAKKA